MATVSDSHADPLAVSGWVDGGAAESKSEKYLSRRLAAAGADIKGVAITTFLLAAGIGAMLWLAGGVVAEHWLVPGGLPAWARWAWLAVGAAALVAALVRWILPLVLYRVNLVYAARVIEREHPDLHNDVVNAVLAQARADETTPLVLRSLRRRAARQLSSVSADGVVDRTTTLRLAYALAAIVALACLYQVAAPKSLVVSAARLVAPWLGIAPPSRVAIAPPTLSWRMPGEPAPAAGSDRRLQVQDGVATLVRGRQLVVEGGFRGLAAAERPMLVVTPLRDDGTPEPATAAWRMPMVPGADGVHSAIVPDASRGLERSVELSILAGDARSGRIRVSVIDAPAMLVREVRYDYPDYTGQADEAVEWQGDLRAIEGTRVTIVAECNHPLEAAWVDLGCDGKRKVPLAVGQQDLARARGSFTLHLDADRAAPEYGSYRLMFQPRSAPQASREPVTTEKMEYRIDVEPDRGPEVAIEEPAEQGVRVPPSAPVTVRLWAEDADFGLASVSVETRLRGGVERPGQELLVGRPRKVVRGAATLVPEQLGAGPGAVLEYRGVAKDTRPESPNIATTDWQELTIDATAPPRQPPPAPQDDGSGEGGDSGSNEGEMQDGQGEGGDASDPGGRGDAEGGDGGRGEDAGEAGGDEAGGKSSSAGDSASDGGDDGGSDSAGQKGSSQGSKQDGSKQGDGKQGGSEQGKEGEQKGGKQGGAKDDGGKQEGEPAGGAQQGDRRQSGGKAGDEGAAEEQKPKSQRQPDPKQGGEQGKPQEGEEQGGGEGGKPQDGSQGKSGKQPGQRQQSGSRDGDGNEPQGQGGSQQQGGRPGELQDGSGAGEQRPSGGGGKGKGERGTTEQGGNDSGAGDQRGDKPGRGAKGSRGGEQDGGDEAPAGESSKGSKGGRSAPQQTVAADGTDDGEAMERILENRRRSQKGGREAGQKDDAHHDDDHHDDEEAGGKPAGDRPSKGSKGGSGSQGDDESAQPPEKAGGEGEPAAEKPPACSDKDGKPCAKSGCTSCGGVRQPPPPGSPEAGTPPQGKEGGDTNPAEGKPGEQPKPGEKPSGEQATKSDDGGEPAAQKPPACSTKDGKPCGKQGCKSCNGGSSGQPGSSAGSSAAGSSASDKGDEPGKQSPEGKPGSEQEQQGSKPVEGASKPGGGKEQAGGGKPGKGGSEAGGKQGGAEPGQQAGGGEKPGSGEGKEGKPGPSGEPGQPAAPQAAPGTQVGAGGAAGRGGDGGDAGQPASREDREMEWGGQDLANARNAADLAIEHLQRSVEAGDTQVLDELGWTPQQARDFLARWEAMRRLARSGDERQRGEYDRAVRSLGLRPGGVRSSRDVPADAKGGQAEGRRSRPPSDYREQFKAFMQGTALE